MSRRGRGELHTYVGDGAPPRHDHEMRPRRNAEVVSTPLSSPLRLRRAASPTFQRSELCRATTQALIEGAEATHAPAVIRGVPEATGYRAADVAHLRGSR